MAAIDLARVRHDTPGVAHVTHFNNAGSSLPPRPVLDAQTDHLWLEARVGGYEAAAIQADGLDRFYDVAAALVGGRADQIAFTDSATRAWDLGFYGVPLAEGDRILVSKSEYASNVIAMLQVAARTGATIEVVPDDEHGQIDVEALAAMLDDRVKLVTVVHVPTQGGLVNPVAEVGAALRGTDALFLLDACQSAGQLPIDVAAIGCDVLCATGRKFLRGPRGTGFLWISDRGRERIEPPTLDLFSAEWTADRTYEVRGDARRYELWETGLAAKLGLVAAIDYALAVGLEAIEARVVDVAERLRTRLEALHGVTVHDLGRRRCGIVTFTIDGWASPDGSQALREQQINTSVTSVSGARWDLADRGLDQMVRASVHYFNTDQELERLVDAVADLSVRPGG
ncbi:MAG TPA: aminotransferase class V-fold PLP-dependent enzyme [Acidimicrobiales bacterium]|nr:aminotransferase class V-fold PLP-dependent enzyme [Acidimicrobiales bacterium]